ncbi:MAG: HPr(Ser) kinase/phosphatase [Clostridia bacterium]|nr:HPr(Ser) kinase/phosphatase [Clostridia bacterium]
MASVSLSDLIKDLNLDVICKGEYDNINITTSDINRPGLQFANYFAFFAEDTSTRLQVVGMIEMVYINDLEPMVRKKRLEQYFSYPIPCVIICRDLEPSQDMIEIAIRNNQTLLKTKLITTKFINQVVNYLDNKLAPRMNLHAVLVDVYGLGILLMGESGIGKSETALELIKRGHRLVSDDVVNIKKVATDRLIGEPPESIRYFMEIRGIGIINVQAMYGVGAIINAKSVDLVVNLISWKDGLTCERLGIDEEFTSILDVAVRQITIPVKPGRNLAIIIEAAARDFRLKKLGYNAAQILNDNIIKLNETN